MEAIAMYNSAKELIQNEIDYKFRRPAPLAPL